jgi:hypothetical protein
VPLGDDLQVSQKRKTNMENNDIQQGDPGIAGALRFIGWASIVIGVLVVCVAVANASPRDFSTGTFAIGIACALSGIPFLGFGYAISTLWRIEMILLGADPRVAVAAPLVNPDK